MSLSLEAQSRSKDPLTSVTSELHHESGIGGGGDTSGGEVDLQEGVTHSASGKRVQPSEGK